MFGVNWSDPQTLWLNVTNLALGAVTLAAVLVAAGAVARELLFQHRRVREADGIDAEHGAMFPVMPHTLHVPGLGLTMADGGVPVEPPAAAKTAAPKTARK